MDNLEKLAASVTEFATTATMTIVPAVPTHDYGPEVCLGPDTLGLPGFLTLAQNLGGGVLYLRAVPFDPDNDDDQPDDPPAHLINHKGRVGQISVAFAANGLVHFWEDRTAWYLEWRRLADVQSPRSSWRDSLDPDESERLSEEERRLSEEERSRLVSELVDTLLADPEFRAAKPGGARQRFAKLAIPPDADRAVFWDASREACERADELARAQYAQITDRLNDLAAQLLASPEYEQASAPAARKHAAEQFLIPHADGFSPPSHVRDELYARAQRLAKTAKSSAGLF